MCLLFAALWDDCCFAVMLLVPAWTSNMPVCNACKCGNGIGHPILSSFLCVLLYKKGEGMLALEGLSAHPFLSSLFPITQLNPLS